MGGNVTQAEVKESAKVLRLETDGHIWGTEKDGALKFHSTDPYARSTIYELCDLGKFLSPSPGKWTSSLLLSHREIVGLS